MPRLNWVEVLNMKRPHLIAALLSALLLLCACPALAQLDALKFDADKVPVGRDRG